MERYVSIPKCVMIIDHTLPAGVIANTAAVLALSLGKAFPELIGHDLHDERGDRHLGITTLPVTILKSDRDGLRRLRETLKAHEAELTVIDLAAATRSTRDYAAYAQALERTPLEQLDYQGIALFGASKAVNAFSGSLGLLR
jgi:hypothetical protein